MTVDISTWLQQAGSRLRAERERLGLKAGVLATAGGVNRNSQSEYETGKRPCTVGYLAGVESLGVDLAYLVTGKRDRGSLGDDEAEWLACFDLLDDDERDAMLRMVQVMVAKRRRPTTVHAPLPDYRAG